MMQEKMSRKEAVLLGSILYFLEISLAISPFTMMDTVLLAVAASMIAVRTAIPTEAYLEPLKNLFAFWISHFRPP